MEIWTLGQLSRQCHALIVPGYGGCLPRARHRQEHRRRHLARSQNSKWKFLDFLRKFEWSRPDCFDLDRFCWGWGVEEALFWFSIGPRAERYDRGERQPFREREWSEGARIANMWLRAFFAVVVIAVKTKHMWITKFVKPRIPVSRPEWNVNQWM